jgi:recombinational DNA repair protein RecT
MAKDFTRTLQSDPKGASDTFQTQPPTAKKTWQPRSPQQTQSQQPSREAEIVEALKAPDFAKEIAQILKDRNEPVVDAEEFIRHAIRQIQSPDLEAHDKLVLCTPASVQAAVKKLAVMGLSPNADQGEGWLVPRWSKKAGTLLAKPVPGVRGMEHKLMETGKVAIIESRAIYLQDFCTVKLGTEKSIQHEVNFCPDPEKPNQIIGSYGIVELKDGRREIAVKRLYRPAGPRKGQDPQEQSQENNAGQERAGYMDEETSACYAAQRLAMKGALNKFFKDNKTLQAIAELEDQSYESAINPEAKHGAALKGDPLQNAIVIPRAQLPGTSPQPPKTDLEQATASQQRPPNGNESVQHSVDQIIEGVRHQYGDAETAQTVRR